MLKENSSFKIIRCGEAEFKVSNKQINYWLTENRYSDGQDCYRIWYVKKGTAEIKTIYGKTQLKEGKGYFFPIYTIMSAAYSDFLTHSYIDFLPNGDFFSFFDTKPYIANNAQLVSTLLEYLKDNHEKDNDSSQFFCSSMIFSALACFFDETKEFTTDSVYANIKSYIDSHFCDANIRIQTLAKKFNFSIQHFDRLFKKNQNISPKNYIINKRIIKAQSLLKGTDKSVRAISEECGFEDALYFSKVFKKILGMSPLNFRKNNA